MPSQEPTQTILAIIALVSTDHGGKRTLDCQPILKETQIWTEFQITSVWDSEEEHSGKRFQCFSLIFVLWNTRGGWASKNNHKCNTGTWTTIANKVRHLDLPPFLSILLLWRRRGKGFSVLLGNRSLPNLHWDRRDWREVPHNKLFPPKDLFGEGPGIYSGRIFHKGSTPPPKRSLKRQQAQILEGFQQCATEISELGFGPPTSKQNQ